MLNPASRADAPDEAQRTAASQSDTAILSAEARVALSDFIQAQGFNCPSVTDGTPSGEVQSGQVIRVRCDNDLNFKVTMRSQGPMMFAVAPEKISGACRGNFEIHSPVAYPLQIPELFMGYAATFECAP